MFEYHRLLKNALFIIDTILKEELIYKSDCRLLNYLSSLKMI
jgi:hypothetical protein